MQTLISGQAGLAIIIEGNHANILHIDAIDKPIPCPIPYINSVLQGATDVQRLNSNDLKTIKATLELSWKSDRALFFFLILLSPDENPRNYELALESLNELLNDKKVCDFIMNQMFTAPLPDQNRIENALSDVENFPLLLEMFEELMQYQDLISEIALEWESLPISLFVDKNNKEATKYQMGKNGIQRKMAYAIQNNSFNDFQLVYYTICTPVKKNREILQKWAYNLKPKNEKNKLDNVPLQKENDFLYQRTESGKKNQRIHDKFVRIKKQIKEIRDLLLANNIDLAKKYVNELVNLQETRGDHKYAAKSLCDIANGASDIANYSLQLEWTKQAVELAPNDGWAHGQLAESYLKLKKYEYAETHYKLAVQYGNRAYGLSGSARILQKSGELDKALEQYNNIIEEFPQDINIIVGKAKTLSNMHKFDEALVVLDKAIEGKNVDICVTRAHIMRYMGELEDALRSYDNIIKNPDFAPALEAYCGKAATFKEMGRFDDSEDAYRQTIKKFPNDPKAVYDLINLLIECKKFDKALNLYNESKESFEYCDQIHLSYANILQRQGKLDQAEVIYKNFTNSKNSYIFRNSYAKFLKSQERYTDSLREYDKLIKDFPYDTSAYIGRAKILKVLGELDKAIASYDFILSLKPQDLKIKYSKAALLIAADRYEDAKVLLDDASKAVNPSAKVKGISYYIKGILKFKESSSREQLREVKAYFEYGLKQVQYWEIQQSFNLALVTVNIKLESFGNALEQFESLDDNYPFTKVLAMQVNANIPKTENIAKAKEIYKKLKNMDLPEDCEIIVLADEVAAFYGLFDKNSSHSNDNWIMQEDIKQALLSVA